MSKRYRILFTFCCLALLYCCKQSKAPGQTNDTEKLVNGNSKTEYVEGARLMAANDCLTCHNVTHKMVGPSFAEIATRYHNDQKYTEYLTNSVLRGSKGAWGGNAEMTPHPHIQVAELREMINYILSVKEKQ